MRDCILGIDTSCYTTSAALVSGGKILASERKLLNVPEGERGLRQADGVFQHIKALPGIVSAAMQHKPEGLSVTGICVSAKPCDTENSYMPVFATGKAFAEVTASVLNVPVVYTSHQQGHIKAAAYESGLGSDSFVALHLSGGTTQTILCDAALHTTEIGGTSDLNAGQLVDRVGVSLGLGFPCGPQLESLARNGVSHAVLPLSRNGLKCSFSGAETQMQRLIATESISKEDAAAEVYSYLARSVGRLIADAVAETGVTQVLLAGGVASSGLLRSLLPARLKKLNCSVKVFWGKPELSGDNACGVALIGETILNGKDY